MDRKIDPVAILLFLKFDFVALKYIENDVIVLKKILSASVIFER